MQSHQCSKTVTMLPSSSFNLARFASLSQSTGAGEDPGVGVCPLSASCLVAHAVVTYLRRARTIPTLTYTIHLRRARTIPTLTYTIHCTCNTLA